MQVVLEIPKEFVDQFNHDRFEDSLKRIEADVLSEIKVKNSISGLYEIELIEMLLLAFEKCSEVNKMSDEKIIDMVIEHLLEMYEGLSEECQHIFDMGELYGKITAYRTSEGSEEAKNE